MTYLIPLIIKLNFEKNPFVSRDPESVPVLDAGLYKVVWEINIYPCSMCPLARSSIPDIMQSKSQSSLVPVLSLELPEEGLKQCHAV